MDTFDEYIHLLSKNTIKEKIPSSIWYIIGSFILAYLPYVLLVLPFSYEFQRQIILLENIPFFLPILIVGGLLTLYLREFTNCPPIVYQCILIGGLLLGISLHFLTPFRLRIVFNLNYFPRALSIIIATILSYYLDFLFR